MRENRKGRLFARAVKPGHKRPTIHRIAEFPVPHPRAASQIGNLFIGYEDETYLYEVWDMVRRLFLTSIFTLIHPTRPRQQMNILLLFICFCIGVQGMFSPYTSPSTDALSLALQFCLFGVVFCGLSGYESSNLSDISFWGNFSLFFVILGVVLSILSLLWELYFGRAMTELAIYNDGKCPDDQLSAREWMELYNARLRRRYKELRERRRQKKKQRKQQEVDDKKAAGAAKVFPTNSDPETILEAEDEQNKAANMEPQVIEARRWGSP